ncbi:MAG: ethanolamine ammonia-lyase subunit EutC [Holophaga sp.]|jgi:ethanolamine ammonia-lyase small subunit
MEPDRLEAVIAAVVKELEAALPAAPAPPPPPAEAKAPPPAAAPAPAAPGPRPGSTPPAQGPDLRIDLPDPTLPEARRRPGITDPADADGLAALMESTTARIGVGRAGPCLRTAALNLFTSDLAVTKDALARDVDPALLARLGLFTVRTRVVGGKEEFLLRPDLGRQLDDEARRTVKERCLSGPDVQICAGDGLSAQAVEVNLEKILPVLQSGCATAGLSLGTPFFIQHCRVGVLNDIGGLLQPKVAILLIGERPGLGRADSLSAYMAYRPQPGHTDAERDVICNIFDGGGANPLEAGAYALRLAQRMIRNQASGVKLKLMEE